jgi:hypothetical protein
LELGRPFHGLLELFLQIGEDLFQGCATALGVFAEFFFLVLAVGGDLGSFAFLFQLFIEAFELLLQADLVPDH